MPLMTLSIELLPAPFGPMMARISCSSTLKEMFVSACTPPKRSEIEVEFQDRRTERKGALRRLQNGGLY